MNNLVEMSVVGRAETVLKKLGGAGIAAHRVRVSGATVRFAVAEEYVEKVFAIFAHRCYNVTIRRKSARSRLIFWLSRRFCLVVGAFLFVAAAMLSDAMVLKIKVTGSAAYLAPEVVAVAKECGISRFSFCRNADVPLLKARLLAMDGVTFCSVTRAGAYCIIEIEAQGGETDGADYSDFISPESGKLLSLVVVCGTALIGEGEAVTKGEGLIGAYSLDEAGNRRACLAVGFAKIEVSRTVSVFFTEDNEDNASSALGASGLYTESTTDKSYTVSPCDGGVIYEVSFTYVVTAAFNME